MATSLSAQYLSYGVVDLVLLPPEFYAQPDLREALYNSLLASHPSVTYRA